MGVGDGEGGLDEDFSGGEIEFTVGLGDGCEDGEGALAVIVGVCGEVDAEAEGIGSGLGDGSKDGEVVAGDEGEAGGGLPGEGGAEGEVVFGFDVDGVFF